MVSNSISKKQQLTEEHCWIMSTVGMSKQTDIKTTSMSCLCLLSKMEFHCLTCTEITDNEARMIRHQLNHHVKGAFKCECNISFNSHNGVYHHVQKFHKGKALFTGNKKNCERLVKIFFQECNSRSQDFFPRV